MMTFVGLIVYLLRIRIFALVLLGAFIVASVLAVVGFYHYFRATVHVRPSMKVTLPDGRVLEGYPSDLLSGEMMR